MTTQNSFSKIEKKLQPLFRQQIGSAESTEDVKKFFVHTALELLDEATGGTLTLEYEDVSLQPGDEEQPYSLSDAITTNDDFAAIWQQSDLPHILTRFAVSAVNRYRHLEKNPEKTEAKIRMG